MIRRRVGSSQMIKDFTLIALSLGSAVVFLLNHFIVGAVIMTIVAAMGILMTGGKRD